MQVLGKNDLEWSVIDDLGTQRTVPRSPGTDAWLGIFPIAQMAPPPVAPEPLPTPVPTPPQSQGYQPQGLAGNLAYGLGSIPRGINALTDKIETGLGSLTLPAMDLSQTGQNIAQGFQAGTGNAPPMQMPGKNSQIPSSADVLQDTVTPQPTQPAGSNFGGSFARYANAVNQQQRANTEVGNAEAAKLSGQADILGQGMADVKAQQIEDQKRTEANRKIIQQDFLDIQNTQIDPQRFWNSRNTGQKVAATLGLMIGSVGSSFSKGGPNFAMEIFNRAVDQDIDAQKANMGKKMNLFRFNYERFKDEDMAAAATRMQILTYAQRQAEIMGMKASSPIVQARTKALNAELEQKKALVGMDFEMAMAKASGGVPSIPRTAQEAWLRTVPEKRQREAVKELGILDSITKAQDQAFGIYKDVIENVNLVSKVNPFGVDRAKWDLSNAQIIRTSYDLQGRQLSDKELKETVGKYKVNNFDLLNKDRLEAKQKALVNELQYKFGSTPTLKAFGYPIDKHMGTTPLKKMGIKPEQRIQ